MITVRLPREIKEFKEKVVWGLTWRQLICSIIALLIAIGVGILLNGKVPDVMHRLIVVSVGVFFGAFGFFKKNGLTFEKFVMIMVRFFFTAYHS